MSQPTRHYLVSVGLWDLGGGERVVLALGLGGGGGGGVGGAIVKGCKRLPSCAPAACVSVAVEH